MSAVELCSRVVSSAADIDLLRTTLAEDEAQTSSRLEQLDHKDLDGAVTEMRHLAQSLHCAVLGAELQPADPEIGHRQTPGLPGYEGVHYVVNPGRMVHSSLWQVPQYCIPIHANVINFDWDSLIEEQQFDAVMMDPPWCLATHNPTRGVALGYNQLTDQDLLDMPVGRLQPEGGLLFVWVINAKWQFTMDLFEHWGYKMVDTVVWVKATSHRRVAAGHGFYLQHAKEVCLVARKGDKRHPGVHEDKILDMIFSERLGQSQKPEEIYCMVESVFPGGSYLEIFGRKNNLRNFWVSLGNEVTGTGLPPGERELLEAEGVMPVQDSAATAAAGSDEDELELHAELHADLSHDSASDGEVEG